MRSGWRALAWLAVMLAGAAAYASLALPRGEPVNAATLVIAAVCSYALGYRFYAKWLAARVMVLQDRRATPAEVLEDGKDYVPTHKWIVFGHHFAAISGPGPLVGPVLAAQFGYLPGTLWLLIGCVLGGAVQDFVILFCSMRRGGRSLGEMVREELNRPAGLVALVAILAILVILLAVLALVVVKALAESPWGVFTVGATIPLAMAMGLYLRFWRVGRVREASALGVVGLLLAVWAGKWVYEHPTVSGWLTLSAETLAWGIIGYGLLASVLPVWLLLAPRDYLSTFMKLGTIVLLALGILLVLPDLKLPPVTAFVDGSGPVVAGKLFPFCFITIACGAISGFHSLISSGTTPKLIMREGSARPVGYGAMCLESFVAIMAMVAACTMEPGVYFSMNMKGEPEAVAARVTAAGYPVTVEQMEELARSVGEHTLFGRTGGAATLAVGMAQIFSRMVGQRWLDLWYHFAIMFEALFILTTIDAGTRVARYILHDFLGHLWRPLGNTRSLGANLLVSGLMVGAWGYFLVQGVRDPLGGINSLWPLFGIANQMLAAIALCLGTTVILKMELRRRVEPDPAPPDEPVVHRPGRPALALVTLVPLAWLVAVTFTAGIQKIAHPDPRIGFLAQARQLTEQVPALESALADARARGDAAAVAEAERALRTNRVLRFNNRLDAVVAGVFLALVSLVLGLSAREWWCLWTGRKAPVLHEMPPVWLDARLVAGRGGGLPVGAAGAAALALALSREWSGEASLERAMGRTGSNAGVCRCAVAGGCEGFRHGRAEEGRLYEQVLEERFQGVRRCC
ncbi:carbon starvation protein A [Limisphaera ngatamarikiensis]|uniref:Carbon starvation protein A n=1 Tax=Limisphaera ngatamarikiensis TaxID=1324935 RepID=A0A6M1RQ33_9BACT|nr:carbon starvation CstA family protein [Limisphaera ngatamarikiensis]NGO39783.1 carbon starvation protein A [Limisphaera ngatamarikiensis]